MCSVTDLKSEKTSDFYGHPYLTLQRHVLDPNANINVAVSLNNVLAALYCKR